MGKMKEIKLKAGGRKTLGVVAEIYLYRERNAIMMGGILRRNAKIGISEIVTVRKADVKEVKSITLSHSEKGIAITASQDMSINSNLLITTFS